MFKVCEKCGFMYDDASGACPQCNNAGNSSAENVAATDVNNTTETGAPVINNTYTEYTPAYKEVESPLANISMDDINEKLEKDIKPFVKEKIIEPIKKHKKLAIGISGGVLGVIVVLVVVLSIVLNAPVKVNIENYVSSTVYTNVDTKEYVENYNGDDEYYYDDYYTYNPLDDYYYQDGYYYSNDEYDDYYSSLFNNKQVGAGLVVNGYNGAAYIEEDGLYNIINWDDLSWAINDGLSDRKKVYGSHLTFDDIYSTESFYVALSPESKELNGKLKNGDVIVVDYSLTQTRGAIECPSHSGSISYTIEGLEDVSFLDPFKYVKFEQSGANSYGVAKLKVPENLDEEIPDAEGFKVTYYDDDMIALEQNDYIIGKISFYFDNDDDVYSNDFSNGDTVTMYCSSIDNLTEEYDLYINSYSKDYKFNSLGEYITKDTKITDKDLTTFKSHAQKYIKEKFSSYSSYSNFKFNSAYVADPKDLTVSNYFRNELCLIYSYTYTSGGWFSPTTKETRYLYISYENLIADKNGSITQTPNDYFDDYESGYDSVSKLLEDAYDSSYNVSKIQ